MRSRLAGGGGGNSSDKPVTPVEKPAITAPLANQSVKKGETATFTVTATGGGTLTYQWKRNDKTISGATSSSYTTPPTDIADNGAVFSVSVSNSTDTVTGTATLTVSDIAVAPAISTQPADQSATTGQTATFSVVATGTSLNYQWKKGGKDITGANAATYNTPVTVSGDNATVFTVVVSNSVGSVLSSPARLTVAAAAVVPTITTQPTAQTVTAGQSATFSVTATGTSLNYQWKKGGKDITGANAATYNTPVTVSGDNGAVFTVEVSNSTGTVTVTSNSATLTVTAAAVVPTITTQPAAQSVTEGQTASFSVTATGSGLTYQWKKNDSDISGATSSTYTTPATTNADIGVVAYSVVVSNSAGSRVTSNNRQR